MDLKKNLNKTSFKQKLLKLICTKLLEQMSYEQNLSEHVSFQTKK
jgi:hypothetical protein